ncbi:MAG TPA: hypothetical protein VMW72_10770 [Sedimentisphaerales bacterium]|nr:hypothetical protein [Sedimentisphaerales bacterium]
MTFAYPVGTVGDFVQTLRRDLWMIQNKCGDDDLVLPIGIFLVVDEDNGGDATAQELVKRLFLLDRQSRHSIDFFYLGWSALPETDRGSEQRITFDVDRFTQCLSALRDHGVTNFGGNADLLLVDAKCSGQEISLEFDRAIRIDLSRRVAEKEMATLGEFLQNIIAAAHKLNTEEPKRHVEEVGAVYVISDDLGILYSKESILDWILDKWGKIIGARRLRDLTVRNIGPKVDLSSLDNWAFRSLGTTEG